MMKSHTRPKISRHLTIDANGQLRLETEKERKSFWKVYIHPKDLFMISAGGITFLVNVLVFITLEYVVFRSMNLQQPDFWWTSFEITAMVMVSISVFLALFFLIMFKVYESKLESKTILTRLSE